MDIFVIRGIIFRSITILSILILLSGCHHSSGGSSSAVNSENADLTNLVLSSGTLSPQFDVDTTSYTAQVANNVSSITAMMTTADSNFPITVNGQAVSSGKASQSINLSVGANTITIVVTAQDGTTTKTYTVVIKRLASNNANLAALSLSTGSALSPVFTPATTGYTAQVANTVSSITITPTAADSTSTIAVNGVTVSSGAASQSINLSEGANSITIVVTAQDKTTTMTYAAVISRLSAANSANLTGLSLSTGSALSPVFTPATTGYTAQVAYIISSIKITPTAADSNSTLTVNGQAVSSGAASQSINLSVGANTITIVVTAPDKITTMTYAVVISRLAASNNANLAALSLSTGGALSPVFTPNTTSYTAQVVYTISSIKITPTAADLNSTITVNGQAVSSSSVSQSINLLVGANPITIVVKAQDKTTTKTYTVVISRIAASNNANLAGLSLSTGCTLSPVFTTNTTSYTGYVPSNITSITITPTAAVSTSAITVNGQAVSSAAASQSINLLVGANTITIVVTAQDGTTTKTYTVSTVRIRPFLWKSGDKIINQSGVYSDPVPANNKPGAREGSVSWRDINGTTLWLFGGYGYDSAGNLGDLNDLWKFSGGNWTWVSGSSAVNQSGIYDPTKGTVRPGGRDGSVSWIDSSGTLWLFGGYGYDSVVNENGYLNDLWKFDSTNLTWTWVSGSNTVNVSGVYGATKGVAGGGPGSRAYSVSWIDISGTLWLFGGWGYDGIGELGDLNDLWKFDSTNLTWTWVSGSNAVNVSGGYGATKGTIGVPGGRDSSISWIGSNGTTLWLFGGRVYSSAGIILGMLNDLWKFDGTNWTWVSGDNIINQIGVYYSSSASANKPGARWGSVSWRDSVGNLWLFGGSGYDSAGNEGYLNDLWKFDSTNWTWVYGSNTVNQSGVYGGATSLNIPGGRDSSVSWIDSSGTLWFFGGYGYDSAGNLGYLNDLWQY